jgi:cytochrome c biogenesis protein CcdA/thiol-disulfide isomerase/thioredoxin
VLPVLPIVFAGGAAGGERRPYAIVGGLVASFSFFTLFAAWLLDQLGLPKDFLRNVALALLFLLAATLVLPRLGELLERPFLFLTRRRAGELGGGFLLGVSLGLVFVPCAGPVLAFITVQTASLNFGVKTILLTIAYAVGTGVPLLLLALGGSRAAARVSAFRAHSYAVRAALGAVMAAAAVAIALDLDQSLQTRLGDYTGFLQRHTEQTAYAKRKLDDLRGSGGIARAATDASLRDYGAAPDFAGISHWLNTPAGRPLSLARLRGRVVLVDFWTYSCINCLRTLPHVEAWDAAYRRRGLTIVGVHTPEFAFEHVESNVRAAVHRLGVRYPVALDNDYATWNAYSNQYWPAKYLIDGRGHVRYVHFGEGEYDRTESLIRRLLGESDARPRSRVPDTTPHGILTPESYLGSERLDRYVGDRIRPGRMAHYRFTNYVAQNLLSYDGNWRVEPERIVAGRGARLRLHFYARDVYLVLAGRGRVEVRVNGVKLRTIRVRSNDLYTLVRSPHVRDALLELRFTPGLAAYAFTFG